ncbi:unnamed protein product [Cylicocyclus nassatus]|uniref:Uncharacterized protein n=1 Tax=Cylicocyclus nassatus TaxID=53992 RepID=A0AA36GKU6_CYLNA|nr:unnamed protein product [Cylicocyclus nassatus]
MTHTAVGDGLPREAEARRGTSAATGLPGARRHRLRVVAHSAAAGQATTAIHTTLPTNSILTALGSFTHPQFPGFIEISPSRCKKLIFLSRWSWISRTCNVASIRFAVNSTSNEHRSVKVLLNFAATLRRKKIRWSILSIRK